MKYNREMQLYAKQKRTQKRIVQAMEQTANNLVAALTALAEAFKKSNRKNEGDENEIQ